MMLVYDVNPIGMIMTSYGSILMVPFKLGRPHQILLIILQQSYANDADKDVHDEHWKEENRNEHQIKLLRFVWRKSRSPFASKVWIVCQLDDICWR